MKDNQAKYPQLRFKGFTDPWVQRNLAYLSDGFSYGLNAAAKEYDGVHGYLRITDIDEVSHSFLPEGLTSPDVPEDQLTDYRMDEQSIVYARTGASTGKTYIYRDSDGELYYAGFLIRQKVNKETSAQFVYQNTLTKAWERYVQVMSQRSGQPGINAQEVGRFELAIPEKAEQDKIAHLFNSLDNLIAANQRKLDLLKEQKKGYLQKMFPKNGAKVPELRFAGFADAWEQRKLSDIATLNARIGWQNLRTSEFLESGDYMLITGTNFHDGTVDYSTVHYVEKNRYEQDTKIQVENGSILITKDGTLGKVALVQGLNMPATLNAGVFNVKIKDPETIDVDYVYQYLAAPFLMKYANAKSTGGTIKHLNQNILIDFPVLLPRKREQVKLAELLNGLDNTITLHQRKLEKLQELKKGYL
ncbi:restriction endonuclease subunit S, partial [Lacticaseibacillus paracasei]|uniref:restriction endonuclease subunit S n=1 Tax=Lacticaseibacillus paracasei TaxID=1597 RepID=UPI002B22655F